MGTAKRERQKQGRQARLEEARAAQARRRRFRGVRNGVIIAVLLVGGLYLYSSTSDDEGSVDAGAGTTTTTSTTVAGAPAEFAFGTGECPAEDGSSPRTIDFTDAPQDCLDPAATYTAVFETSEGTVRVALDTAATPGTANNFVALSRYHFYDETKLFRTDTGIGIIQGGSPHTQDPGDPGPGYALPDEGFDYAAIGGAGGPYSYAPGDLVMARTSAPDGAGAQFFFCVTDACSNLDSQGVYVKFGSVTEGLDVLQAILDLNVDSGQLGGAPSRDVLITSLTIEQT